MSKKYPLLDDKSWLYQQYWEKELNISEISCIIGCVYSTVRCALIRYNIRRRTGSEVKSGQKHPMYGNHHTKETKQKISEGNKGRVVSEEARRRIGTSHLGKTASEETKRKMSNSRKEKRQSKETKRKRAETLRGGHHTKEAIEKIRVARKRQRFPTTRTVIECIYWKISKKNNIPSEYTGDGKIWIGNLNPDFIIRDKRVAIFINGDYWHSPLLNHKLNQKRTVTHQITACKRHRWKAVTIWGTDLEREDAVEFVLTLLKKAGII